MITSTANERVRFLRSLHEAKARRRSGCFLIEGVRLVEEALRAGRRPCLALVDVEQLERTTRGADLLRQLGREEWMPVSQTVLRSVATTVTPQGIVAAVPMPTSVESRGGPAGKSADEFTELGSLVVVLDRLADPGNVGTILRSAEAAGVITVVTLAGSVDVYSPKVVRAGAGAHFHLNLLVDMRWPALSLKLGRRQILVAVAEGGRCHYDVDWTLPSALIIGSEAHGASVDSLAAATGQVSIPMLGRAESLNAAVASSVIMFEALRQRLVGGQLVV